MGTLRDASVDWAIGVMNDGHVIADFDSDLAGEGAHAEVKIVAISSGRQIQGIDTRVTRKPLIRSGIFCNTE